MSKIKECGGTFEVEGDPYAEGFRTALRDASGATFPSCFGMMILLPPRPEGEKIHSMSRESVSKTVVERRRAGRSAGRRVIKCLACKRFTDCSLVTLVGKTSSIRAKVKKPVDDE